jgi:hypothetical protein
MKPPYFSPMHSGNCCIVLEEGVDYGSFPRFAERWAAKLSLTIQKRADGLDARIWECERNGKKFWLAHDNWFPTISLEPKDAEAAAEIASIGIEIGVDEKTA